MPEHNYQGIEGIYMASNAMSSECKDHYASQGWVLIKNFFDLENDIYPIFRDVNNLIKLKLNEVGESSDDDIVHERIDTESFIRLCCINREKGGEIYRATRHLPSLFRLLTRQKNLELASHLMSTEYINLLPYLPIRIDIRGEEKYLFSWHQDYPYTQGSADGIVLWMPLMQMERGFGGIKLIPESHKQGVRRVFLHDPDNDNKNGAHTIEIEDADEFDDMDSYILDVGLTDVIIFSTLLVHKSIPMTKGKVRWATQLRYANFCDKTAVSKGWPGGMIEGSHFEHIHPELIINGH